MTRVTPELVGAPFTVTDPGPMPPTPAIILENPRDPRDVAEVIYAASCYGIGQVWLTGRRVALDPDGPPARQGNARNWEPVNVVASHLDPVAACRSVGAFVVAVERGKPSSYPLALLRHPPEAVYVFGPEDSEVSSQTLVRAHAVVEIPSRHSLYLAGACWVTLYERAAQLGLPKGRALCAEQGGRS